MECLPFEDFSSVQTLTELSATWSSGAHSFGRAGIGLQAAPAQPGLGSRGPCCPHPAGIRLWSSVPPVLS